MDKQHNWYTFGCLLVLSALLAGCKKQDTVKLAKIGNIISRRAQSAAGGVEEDFLKRWQKARLNRQQDLVVDRVSNRLNSDNKLAGSAIEVSVSGNEIELKGVVPDNASRQRAVDLAKSTTGVGKVKNSLRVAGNWFE